MSGFCHVRISGFCLGCSGLRLQINASRETAFSTKSNVDLTVDGPPKTLKNNFQPFGFKLKEATECTYKLNVKLSVQCLELNKLLFKAATSTNAGIFTEYLHSTSVSSNTIDHNRMEPNLHLTE